LKRFNNLYFPNTIKKNVFPSVLEVIGMSEQNRRMTIQDVADRAGVSIATVSAVVNEKSTVKESTRKRVQHVISDLGYQPSRSARRLRLQSGTVDRSPAVGLLVKEIGNPFYAEIARGASEEAYRRRLSLFLVSSEGDAEREQRIISDFHLFGMDGVILAPVLDRSTDLGHVYDMKKKGFPFVLLERVPWTQADVISIDNIEMQKQAVMYLMNKGHRHIVHFSGPAFTAHAVDRVQGFREAFAETELAFSESQIISAGASLEEGYRTGKAFFSEQSDPASRPTAVTCFNDLLAVGLMRALVELNIRIPEDVAVVGFDGDPMTEYLHTPLTTVMTDAAAMGKIAVERLVHQIHHEGEDISSIRVPARLIVRSSA